MKDEHEAARLRLVEEIEANLEKWMAEDECFSFVITALRLCKSDGRDGLDRAISMFANHQSTCTGCDENVMGRASNERSAARRMAYINAGTQLSLEDARLAGGSYSITENAAGIRIHVVLPDGFNPSINAVTVFTPSDPSARHSLEIDVTSAELLSKPNAVIQYLDATAAGHAQSFAKRGFHAVAWWPLLTDDNTDLVLRFEQKTVTYRKRAALVERYRNLVRRRLKEPSHVLDQDMSEGGLAAEVWELVQGYDGDQSTFSSFASATLRNRAMDKWRRIKRQPRLSTEPDAQLDGRMDPRSPEPWDTVEGRQFASAVLSDFCPRERDILSRVLDGKTELLIAAELGLSREYVNRVKNRIRRKINERHKL